MLNPAYKRVTFRAAGAPQGHHNVVALALDVATMAAVDAYRLRFTLEEAERTALALLDAVAVQRYRAGGERYQSLISSGNPSNDGSPQDGQSVCPPAKSSSAYCGDR